MRIGNNTKQKQNAFFPPDKIPDTIALSNFSGKFEDEQ